MISKHKIGTVLLWIAFWLSIIILSSMASGCGSRKKNKASKVRIEQVAKKDMKNIILRNDTKSMDIKKQDKETFSITDKNDIELTQGDADKEIILIEPNGDTTKIKGANAFISRKRKKEKKKENKLDSISFLDKSLIEIAEKSQSESNIKTVDEDLNVDVKRGFPWWIWLILLLVLLIYGYISYLKRSLNPMKWLG